MDRVFLDANILFSAAYQAHSRLRTFWKLPDVLLCTSRYAIEKARRNLKEERQRHDLEMPLHHLLVVEAIPKYAPITITIPLPSKDLPILLGAFAAHATHLITGDSTHFWPFFGRTVEGIRILPPAQYLKSIKLP